MTENTKDKDIFFEKLLKKYNIRPTKSLGQNFLIDNFALNCIVDALNINENDMIIEIGAGLGALSKEIASKTDKFIAIEIDKHLIFPLSEILSGNKNIKIINDDILEIDIEKEIYTYLEEIQEPLNTIKSIKIVGNLPYYITTPIIMKILELNIEIDTIVVMVQKEVIHRMFARPGTNEYGPLAIALQYFYNIETLFNVPAHCFFPKPKVVSAVARFEKRKSYKFKINNKKLFIDVLKACFAQRRKTLINSLSNSLKFILSDYKISSLEKNKIKNIMNQLGIDESARGESLSLEQFVQLSNAIQEYILE